MAQCRQPDQQMGQLDETLVPVVEDVKQTRDLGGGVGGGGAVRVCALAVLLSAPRESRARCVDGEAVALLHEGDGTCLMRPARLGLHGGCTWEH